MPAARKWVFVLLIFGEAAYPITLGAAAVEPFAGLAYVHLDTGSFRERGGNAALRSRGFDQDVGYFTLGTRVAGETMLANGKRLMLKLSVAWQHAFSDVTPAAALAFASTGIGFGVYGVPLARNSALIEAGLELSPSATIGVSYFRPACRRSAGPWRRGALLLALLGRPGVTPRQNCRKRPYMLSGPAASSRSSSKKGEWGETYGC